MPDLNVLKDWAITIAGIIALVTFMAATIEQVRRGRQERSNNFILMRRRFLETPQYREILDMLAQKNPALNEYSMQEKRNFIGFLEEVALMVNSHLIKRDVAYYMFGYYVRLADESDDLWVGLNRKSRYWKLFNHFASEMRAVDSTFPEAERLHF